MTIAQSLKSDIFISILLTKKKLSRGLLTDGKKSSVLPLPLPSLPLPPPLYLSMTECNTITILFSQHQIPRVERMLKNKNKTTSSVVRFANERRER